MRDEGQQAGSEGAVSVGTSPLPPAESTVTECPRVTSPRAIKRRKLKPDARAEIGKRRATMQTFN